VFGARTSPRRLSTVGALAVAAVFVVSAGAGAQSCTAHRLEPAGPPTGKIRVANFFLVAGDKPGPAVDFYDTPQPGKSDKPLISNLGYGHISAYVSPRSDAGFANLYMYPAGSKTFGKPLDGLRSGNNISSSGWVQGQQETVVMGTNSNPNEPSFTLLAEVEPKSPDLRTALYYPPGGQALLAVNVSGLIEDTAKFGDIDVRIGGTKGIGGSCPDNTLPNGKRARDSSNPTTPATLRNYNAADFHFTPGNYRLDVIPGPGPGRSLTQDQCDGAPSATAVGLKLSAAKPTLVFIYGASPTKPRTLVALVG
jgi:hypothetical protein